jgi:SAM-dependent methyltransferase
VLTLHKPTSPPPVAAAARAPLERLLRELYQKQLALSPDDSYLRIHARPGSVRNHVRNFLWYEPHLPPRGAVLDWGCNHAPDSCLLRARFGDRLALHGCDFRAPGHFAAFDEFSRLAFTPLRDLVMLPYPNASFDVVIGSGTLEHTAMDYESLKQLHRVLRPDGLLVITYLPNRWSVQEWARRVLKRGCHQRLYGLDWLKRSGFLPLAAEHQMLLWDAIAEVTRLPAGLCRVLRSCVPVHRFSSTLRLIARKVTSM